MEICASYSGKGFPRYTKRIMELSSVYIKDGEILKNRKGENIIVKNMIDNFNNIAIENNGLINIYCKKEIIERYEQVIENLKTMFCNSRIDNMIIINSN